jgi:putative membrane protein
MKENLVLAKKLNFWAYIISAVVLLLVAGMRRIHIDSSIDFSFLPAIYSFTNLGVAFFLILGLNAIRQKKIERHRKMVTTALVLSACFLLMYVLYHITTPETKYCGVGNVRVFYFILLISHIFLAAVSFPFILFTWIRGFTYQVEKHKKLSRWVFWVWLYVSITGPIVYLMLRPCMKG